MVFISQFVAWTTLAAIATARPLIDPPQQDVVAQTDSVTVSVRIALCVDEDGVTSSAVGSDSDLPVVPTVAIPWITSTCGPPIVSSTVPVLIETSTLVPGPSSQPPVQAVSDPVDSISTTTPAPSTSVFSTTPYVLPVTTTASYSQIGRQDTSPAVSSSPAATQSIAAGNDTTSGANSAAGSDMCTDPSAACVGDITHYDGGLGACGWNVNTASDMQIALPYEFMGTQSNSNPYCGKSLTIKNPTTGQTIRATVGDKCMGCTGRSIDLTDAAFNGVGNGCDGRCSGFQWWFN